MSRKEQALRHLGVSVPRRENAHKVAREWTDEVIHAAVVAVTVEGCSYEEVSAVTGLSVTFLTARVERLQVQGGEPR